MASALGVVEEALERHPGLVSDDFINMAAELHTANRQYGKALQVRRREPAVTQPNRVTSELMHTGVAPLCRS